MRILSPILLAALAPSAMLAFAATTLPATIPPSPAPKPDVQPAAEPAPAGVEVKAWQARGPHDVITTDRFQVPDRTGRGADVPLLARGPMPTPDHVGPFPVLVFSHGAGGSDEAFERLSRHMASHGWVVIHPTHTDSIRRRREAGNDPGEGVHDRQSLEAALEQMVSRVNLPDRVREVRAVLEGLGVIERELQKAAEQTGHGFDTRISLDRSQIAMSGHSAGAMTAQSLAGMRFFPPRGPARRDGIADPEPAFKAFVIISGQGTTRPSINERSWLDLTRPMLVFAGSEDRAPVGNETPASRRHPFEFAPASGHHYLAFIDGATHASYSGPGRDLVFDAPPPPNIDHIADIVNATTLAFLEAHVRLNLEARNWLHEDGPANADAVKLEWRRK